MTKYKPSETVINTYIPKMGKPLAEQFSHIWAELTGIYEIWNEYEILFGTSPERIDLLNKSASHFFAIIESTLFKEIILRITKITENGGSGSRKNLTIQSIYSLIEDNELKRELRPAKKSVVDKTQFCIDWRNRSIAHSDLDLAINSNARPLDNANRLKIKEVLAAIGVYVNIIHSHYMKSACIFDLPDNRGGALVLVNLLQEGLKSIESKNAR